MKDRSGKADIIIPVYKPSERFLTLLDMLEKQSEVIGRIIIINTERRYLDQLISEQMLLDKHKKLTIKHITKEEFDHGETRNLGVSFSDSPYFVMLTDDCMPVDEHLVQNLLAPFQDERIAMSYGRQLPAEGSGLLEQYTRSFNYPKESGTKFAEDIERMGIKAFFASNACAAYRRQVFDALGGFVTHTIFNEDMIFARKVLDGGYGIAYVAEAKVEHSHNYSGIQQFHRNFDLGVSHAQYPEVFSGIPTESEGIKLVKKSCVYVMKKGKPWLVFKLVWQSGCKYVGFYLGKRYRKLPKRLVVSFSMNKDYWRLQKKQNYVTD